MEEKLKETMNWLKKQNLYAAVDVLAIVTLFLLVAAIAKKNEKMWTSAFISAGGAVASGLLQIKSGRSKIENKSQNIIYTKSEEGSDAVEMSSGCRYDIDGLCYDGIVYKLGNGCHGVLKDGSVKIKSATAKLANFIKGGGVLDKEPDNGWKPLFDKAKEQQMAKETI